MKIIPVPCRADNYMYLIHDPPSGVTAVVDPFDPKKLQAAADAHSLKVGSHLLTTHHHFDHSGGNEEFIGLNPGIKVFGGSKQSYGVEDPIKDGDTFTLGGLQVKALATPCHTQDSICYLVTDPTTSEKAVFTGDTLFPSGCGRFFEGNAQEMDRALNQVLTALPNDTVVYSGHEYARGNLEFARSIEPDNENRERWWKRVEENGGISTGVGTIGDEKTHNVFMRLTEPGIKEKTKTTDRVDTMNALRTLKNEFK